MRLLLLQLVFAVSFCYLMFVGIFMFDSTGPESPSVFKDILYNGYYYFGAVIILAFSAVSLGNVIKGADKERHFKRMSTELEAQRQRLIDWVALAKILTVEDTNELVDGYLSKIDKKYIEKGKIT